MKKKKKGKKTSSKWSFHQREHKQKKQNKMRK